MAKNLKDRYDKVNRGFAGLYYTKSTDELEEMGIGVFKCVPGENYIAVLPQLGDDEDYFKEVYVHYDVDEKHSAFLCPKEMYGERCPICEYAAQLKRSGEPKEVYTEFLPSVRYLFFIIDMKDAGTKSKGVQLYDAPRAIMLGIINVSAVPRTGTYLDISDPEKGFNLVFKRRGEKMNTKYEGFQREDRSKPIPEKFLDAVVPFDEILVQPDLKAMEDGMFSPKDDAESDRTPPRSETPSRSRRQPESEEEEEAPRKPRREADAEEETPPPARRTASRRQPEPEEEPEEAPPASRRAASRRSTPEEHVDGRRSGTGRPKEDEEASKREDVRDAVRRRRRELPGESEDEEAPF